MTLSSLKENKVIFYEAHTKFDFDDQSNSLLYNIVTAVTEYEAELRKNRFKISFK